MPAIISHLDRGTNHSNNVCNDHAALSTESICEGTDHEGSNDVAQNIDRSQKAVRRGHVRAKSCLEVRYRADTAEGIPVKSIGGTVHKSHEEDWIEPQQAL